MESISHGIITVHKGIINILNPPQVHFEYKGPPAHTPHHTNSYLERGNSRKPSILKKNLEFQTVFEMVWEKKSKLDAYFSA